MARSREPAQQGAPREAHPVVVNGWTLYVWPAVSDRSQALCDEVARLRRRAPVGYRKAPATRMLAALRDAVLRDVPADPGAERFRQGKTLGAPHTHWRRLELFGRFRLFFRYSSQQKVIVYAWLNDENTLRKSGSRTDPYRVFRGMLERGRPPNDWDDLVRACRTWTEGETEG